MIFKPRLFLTGIGGLIAAAWLCGFLNFVATVQSMQDISIAPDRETVDAIVVLTGGSERVGTGIKLLEAGAGKKLFISGVHKKLSIESILGTQNVAADLRSCCIILGYQAGSTLGNAEETRAWMTNEGYTSLRLVTANYHMPRSLLLFHTAMPTTTIIPHPVTPDNFDLAAWWEHETTLERLVTEYNKYLFACLRLAIEG